MMRKTHETTSSTRLSAAHLAALGAAIFTSLFTSTALAEPPTEAVEVLSLFAPRPEVLSARGPRPGEGVVGLGLGFFGPLPALELRYVRGLGERAAIDGVLSTAGIVQRLRFGARYRLTADDAVVHAAVRASILEVHSFDDQERLAVGIGPGVLVSFDEAAFSWTLALDAAWSFLDDGGFASSHRAVQLHPSIGVELPVDRSVEVTIEASTLFTVGSDGALWAVPMLGAGLAW